MGDRGGADDGHEGQSRLGRRQVIRVGASSVALAIVAGFGVDPLAGSVMASEQDERQIAQTERSRGRLTARPKPATESGPLGLQPLGLDDRRDGLVYVPAGYLADRPAPLVLMLHGAGSNAQSGLQPLLSLADEAGLILLAVDSRQRSWDVIVGGYGPDVAFIDRALTQTFARYAVDVSRIAVEGFSDGASYALSIGITNGDLFTNVLAFSPGFSWPGDQQGAPRLFISHGTGDEVLPIDTCSRRIVPKVERAGYDVRYREFDGGHTVPTEIAQEAVTWFAGS